MQVVPPWWRRVYDTFEKPVGDGLAAGARSGTFADVMALAVRLPRRLQQETERRTRRALHLANLPTATDVRRLSEQVAELHREVRALGRGVDGATAPAIRPRPEKKPTGSS